MASPRDHLPFIGEDTGCRKLEGLLGHPVTCLECPIEKCLLDMSIEETIAIEKKLAR